MLSGTLEGEAAKEFAGFGAIGRLEVREPQSAPLQLEMAFVQEEMSALSPVPPKFVCY